MFSSYYDVLLEDKLFIFLKYLSKKIIVGYINFKVYCI